ncbi:MAG: hypothetical protein AB7D51_01620 [Desulfovibrionaceae bacterium]
MLSPVKILPILLCLAALLLPGCSSGGPGPGEVAKAAFEATVSADMNTAKPLYCPAMQDIFPSQEEMDALRKEIGIDFSFDFSDLTYTVLEEEGDRAVVGVKGTLKVTADGQTETVEYNERIHLVRLEGDWLVCEK